MSIRDGVLHPAHRTYHWHDDGQLQRDEVGQPLWSDERGDGTVFRYAAAPDSVTPTPVVQSHGGLAQAAEVRGRRSAGWCWSAPGAARNSGTATSASSVPDLVTVAEAFDLAVTGEDDPALVEVRLHRVDDDLDVPLPVPPVGRRSGIEGLHARVRLTEPGLYRVAVHTGGGDPVTQLVICGEPDG